MTHNPSCCNTQTPQQTNTHTLAQAHSVICGDISGEFPTSSASFFWGLAAVTTLVRSLLSSGRCAGALPCRRACSHFYFLIFAALVRQRSRPRGRWDSFLLGNFTFVALAGEQLWPRPVKQVAQTTKSNQKEPPLNLPNAAVLPLACRGSFTSFIRVHVSNQQPAEKNSQQSDKRQVLLRQRAEDSRLTPARGVPVAPARTSTHEESATVCVLCVQKA